LLVSLFVTIITTQLYSHFLNSELCCCVLCQQKLVSGRDYGYSDNSWLDQSWDDAAGWPLWHA